MNLPIFSLADKVAIVTGGSEGIGFAIARGLATAGAIVIIVNRRAVEGQKAAESLKKEGFNAVAIPADVSIKSSVEAMVSKVVADFGRIDILVNNAGVSIRKPAEEITEEDWDHVMNINLKGLFFCCQLAGREMIRNKKGKIINIASIMAYIVRPRRTAYAASKAGVSHLTRALAVEWAKYNINVNAIAPGVTITEHNRKYFEEHPEELNELISSTPQGRASYPPEYVGAAIFFASDASDFVTGQTLYVDGGITIL